MGAKCDKWESTEEKDPDKAGRLLFSHNPRGHGQPCFPHYLSVHQAKTGRETGNTQAYWYTYAPWVSQVPGASCILSAISVLSLRTLAVRECSLSEWGWKWPHSFFLRKKKSSRDIPMSHAVCMRKNWICQVGCLEQMVPIRKEVLLENGLFKFRFTSNLNCQALGLRSGLAVSQEVARGYLLEQLLKSMQSSRKWGHQTGSVSQVLTRRQKPMETETQELSTSHKMASHFN